MNGRRFAVMLGCTLMSVACATFAATLPMEIRTTTNGDSAKPVLQAFLDKQVAQLASSVPSQQSLAREAIAAEVVQPVNPTDPPLSPVFLDLYAGILNDGLKPLESNPDPRVRLNVAIVAAKVAEKASNDKLAPVVTDLLSDQSEGVVLWSIKACKFLLPQILANAVSAPNNPLLPAFVKSVEQHSKSGPIVHAAYDALRADSTTVAPAAWNQVVPVLVTTAQTLLENRIAQYHAGIPPQPSADAVATTFLTDTTIWPVQSKDQQQRSVQDIADLMSVAAQRWDNANTTQRQDLALVVKQAGGAIWVVGKDSDNSDLQHAEEQLKVTPSAPSSELVAQLEVLRIAIKNVPDFADLKAAPSLEPIATSAPASEPSTP
jgi:hypothetical protein